MKLSFGWFSERKWQDKLFALGEIVFMTSLLPSVLSPEKPAPLTSVTTALMLYSFLFIHYSYKLWMTFTLTVVTASLWMLLFFQAL